MFFDTSFRFRVHKFHVIDFMTELILARMILEQFDVAFIVCRRYSHFSSKTTITPKNDETYQNSCRVP